MTINDIFSSHIFIVVIIGTTIIGILSGVLGVFPYLNKQSLLSDVVAHAALPGAMFVFIVVATLTLSHKNPIYLISGAAASGLLATFCVYGIKKYTVISIDTAMAIVLSVFFGAGLLLLQVINNNPYPDKGGIAAYLFGNVSTLTREDLIVSAVVGAISAAIMLIAWRGLTTSSFDPQSAFLYGFKKAYTTTALYMMIVLVIVVGIKAVGLVLMVAFLITPASAARQWVKTVGKMIIVSGAIGALGGLSGAIVSIYSGRIPTGPIVVLALFAILVFSIFFSPSRGLLFRYLRIRQSRKPQAEIS